MIINLSNNNRGVQEQVGRTNESKNKNKGSIFAGESKLNQNDGIALKRQQAQKKAMKIVGDVFANRKETDEGLEARSQRIRDLTAELGLVQEEINKIDESKAALREAYGVKEDSTEQKDLDLLVKRNNSLKMNSNVKLTQEDKDRLVELKSLPRTDYQKKYLEYEAMGNFYKNKISKGNDTIVNEYANINTIKLERSIPHSMIDAQDIAEDIIESASKEIIGMLVDEALDHIDEEIEEDEAVAEKKTEKEEEQKEKIDETNNIAVNQMDMNTIKLNLELSSAKLQSDIKEIIDSMKLIEDDIKGAAVDAKI